MKGQKRKMHKHNFFRGIVLALVMTLVVTMCPFPNGNYAYADTSTLVTEQPEIVVTGSGVIGGDSYTGDNVGYEKAYTRSELKAMSGGTDVLYSSIKSQSPYTKQLTRATGVYVSSLLSKTMVNPANGKVSFLAADGFAVHFDPNAAYESGDRTTTSIVETRYAYPGLLEGSDADYTEVQAMLAWAMASGSKDPVTAGSEADSLRLAVGQLNFEDMNNQLYNKEVRTILSGNALTETVLTVGDKAYTRSEVLLMARAERTYSYSGSSGDKTDTVVGVPMSVLLDGHKDSDIVTFGSADNYPVAATGMTVKELIDGNYMLAYENNGNGIYETAKNNTSIYGFLTLYGDGAKPAKLVNNISVESSGGSEGTDTPEDPVTPPAGDTVGDATAETAAISFVGEGLVKEGFFSISGLKNAEGIEKGEFTFEWMNSSGTTGESTVEGAEMKNILKDILGLTDEADTIKFISSDGQETTMALDDMFVKDKTGQRPVLAWKLDGAKCDPRLIVGQADENDNNRSKWVKDIVKIEVTESGGTQGPDDPVTPPAGDTAGDATAETAEISFVGDGLVKEGYFSIKGLKNAEGIEKDTYEFDWKKSSGATGTSAAEGATMRNLLKDIMGITEEANTIVFTSKDGEQKIMALDDMFTKDKDGQRPVLAWKVDGEKCDPQLVVGQADADDVNKGKWIKEIVKVEVLETKVAGELDPVTPPAGDTVGDATAETAELSFVGDGLVKEGYFSIKGLKNAEGIEKGEFTFTWMNSSGSTGTSTAEGVEMRKILKDMLGLTEEANIIKFISSDGEATIMNLDDMFVKDKDGQRPVLAWKLDGDKCNPRLIIGQVDENDKNRSKWVKDIVKIEVTASYIHQDVLGDDYLDNQEELSEIFDTVEEIEDTLYKEMEALVDYEITKANTAVLEIMLVIEDENGNIVPLDKEYFPEEGLDIYIEYDKIFGGKSVDHRNYKYKVIHMFSVDSNGHKAGEIENLDVEITDKGLKVHVKGLSPFAISYEEITPGPELCPECGTALNADGTCSNAANHNSGSGTPGTPAPDKDGTTGGAQGGNETSSQTGDDMNMFAYGAAMILALMGAAAVLYRRRENKNPLD